jgi:uncharacterized protein (DUF1684 family)
MKYLQTALIVLLAAGASGCNAGNPPPKETGGDYVSQIQVERAAKDQAFRDQPNEPVPADKAGQFLPLKYFPPDPEYAVPASLNPSTERTPVEMVTSAGKIRKHERVGVLEFTLKGKPMTLGAYVEEGASLKRLFVPFKDMTSGDRNLCGRPVSRTRCDGERRVHDRFQQSVQPVLLLQRVVRLPVSSP